MNYWLANALNKLKNTPHFFPSCKNERKEPWRYQIIHEYTMYRYIYKLWVSGYACICWSFKFTISGLSPYVYKYLSSMQNLSPKSLQSFSRVICCTVLTFGNLVVSILIWKKKLLINSKIFKSTYRISISILHHTGNKCVVIHWRFNFLFDQTH